MSCVHQHTTRVYDSAVAVTNLYDEVAVVSRAHNLQRSIPRHDHVESHTGAILCSTKSP